MHGELSLVQLRAKSLSPADYRVLVPEVQSVCRAAGARLLLNADPLLAQQLGADGVHLNSARLMAMSERPAGIRLLGASCHTRTEVEHANALGVDFIAVSPVQQTRSHPGAAVLGFDGLRTLTELATVPVYALGGMREADLDMAFRHGAQGIAAISGLWGSFFALTGEVFVGAPCRRGFLDAGFRARRRDTFLCSAKEKYPKERRPEGAARPLIFNEWSGSLRFS